MKIDIYNKGKKDKFCVSKISVNQNSTVCDNQIRKINIEIENIKSLYANSNDKIATNTYNEILFIYKELQYALSNKGITMNHIKSLPYQDIFMISDGNHSIYYRCWYNSKGFITKIEFDCDENDPLICLLKKECENALS